MKYLLPVMKQALSDTNNYLNNLKIVLWLPFYLAFIFLGWNGIQILFSINLILSFVNTRSVTYLVYNTIEYHLRSVPIYLFILITFVTIHWLIHCFFEIGFTLNIHKKQMNLKKIYATGVNFFVPNLIIVISIFFFNIAILMLIIFLQIALSGFRMTEVANLEQLVFQTLNLALYLSIIVNIWLADFVLPRMALGYSFKSSLIRGLRLLNQQSVKIILFYLMKIILIFFSIYVFQLVLRHLLLPFFVMLESRYAWSILLLSSRNLVLSNLLINLRILSLVLFSTLIVYTPIIVPLYLFQRFILFRTFKH
ncbi:MAG: hypothetical protein K0B81_05955 [Candidatus Cloacimonetes bacterium]|nr:hypothetical protein [Candidatus Cloacimonadota bacterium]